MSNVKAVDWEEVQAAEERRLAIIELAREQHQDDGTCEIDDNAVVSDLAADQGGDNGAYVQAWVWVEFSGTPFDKNPEEDDDEED
jgi:hypothetical protein